MTLHVEESALTMPGSISSREFIEPIFWKTLGASVVIPLLFAYLGSTNALSPYLAQSEWLVTKAAVIWPALPPKCEFVLKVRGSGHAASFGFMCAALWTWPIMFAAILLRKHAARRLEILPISTKEIVQFMILVPFAFLNQLLDDTKIRNPLTAFHADQWDFFYLREWLLFTLLGFTLALLLYAIGRPFVNLLHRGSLDAHD